MNKNIIKLNEFLLKKRELFTLYEIETRLMLDCNLNEIEDKLKRRSELIYLIDETEEKIKYLCQAEDEEDELLYKATKNKCNREELPLAARSVFDRAQEIFSIINRVMIYETQVLSRMKENKEEIEKFIKESKNAPNIAKYFNSLDNGFEKGTFISDKKSRV